MKCIYLVNSLPIYLSLEYIKIGPQSTINWNILCSILNGREDTRFWCQKQKGWLNRVMWNIVKLLISLSEALEKHIESIYFRKFAILPFCVFTSILKPNVKWVTSSDERKVKRKAGWRKGTVCNANSNNIWREILPSIMFSEKKLFKILGNCKICLSSTALKLMCPLLKSKYYTIRTPKKSLLLTIHSLYLESMFRLLSTRGVEKLRPGPIRHVQQTRLF